MNQIAIDLSNKLGADISRKILDTLSLVDDPTEKMAIMATVALRVFSSTIIVGKLYTSSDFDVHGSIAALALDCQEHARKCIS